MGKRTTGKMETGTLIDFSNTIRVLEDYRNAVISIYKSNLSNDDHIASGKLINNISYLIQKDTRQVEVSLMLEDYWKYVENDTKPHWPPISKILEWIKVKPVIPSQTYNGKLPTEKQLAFLIARKISEVGTKGTHDLQETLQQVNSMYEVKLGEAISQDLNTAMTAIMMEFNMK